MQFKKILTAAFVAATVIGAGTGAASADPWYGHGYRDHDRMERRVVDHDRIYSELRMRHIRFTGTPYFVRGHYVVRSFDRFGRTTFVEFNPYTGTFVGFVRL